MIMIVFTLRFSRPNAANDDGRVQALSEVGLRISLGLVLIALIIVAIAENARIPVDNPATHLELTMVHVAMVLEYSGRHLALIELSASLKLLLYVVARSPVCLRHGDWHPTELDRWLSPSAWSRISSNFSSAAFYSRCSKQ